MTKEEYIQARKGNYIGDVMYEFYKEGFNAEKHGPFLLKEDFIQYFNMWPPSQSYVPAVLSYFNAKLEVTEVYNKEKQLIQLL